jgi:hypothetical protein
MYVYMYCVHVFAYFFFFFLLLVIQVCGSQITFQQTHAIPARCFAKQADRPALKGDGK